MEVPLETASPEKQLLSDKEVNQLVMAHLTEIRREAKRHLSKKHDLSADDLFQWGVIGAIKAGRKFDPERGIRFFTYAVYDVRRAIRTAIIDEGYRIKLAAHVHADVNRLNQCRHELQRPAEIEELQEMSGISETTIQNTIKAKQIHVRSLQSKVRTNGEDTQTLEDLIPDTSFPAPDEGLEQEEEDNEVHKWLVVLDEKDPIASTVIRQRFGLANDNALTLADIGKKMGVSRERARQISDRGIRRLKLIQKRPVT